MPYPQNHEGSAASDWTAVYAHLMLEIEARIRAQKAAMKALAQEAQDYGVDLKAIREAFKFQDESPEEREARINRLHNTMKALHVPGVQLDMFDVFEPARRPTEDEAYDRGFQAGIYNLQPNPDYEAGAEEGQAWMRGYNDFRSLLCEYHRRFETKEAVDADDFGG